jgi:hypothetical protein
MTKKKAKILNTFYTLFWIIILIVQVCLTIVVILEKFQFNFISFCVILYCIFFILFDLKKLIQSIKFPTFKSEE